MAVRYRAAEYLKQNRFGIFYFRRVIPPGLRAFFAIKQVSQAAAPRLRFSGWLRLFRELRRGVRRPHELGHDLIYLRLLFKDTASPLRRRSLR